MPNIVEQASARIAGKVGSIQAAFDGLKGVFRKLSEEHKEVAVLLKRAHRTEDAEKRADLWATLRTELVAHERAEVNYIYPEFIPYADSADLGEEHEVEADELESLISELDRLAFDSPYWQSSIERLQQAVLRHATREEQYYFPKLQEAIGQARADELGELYDTAKLAIIHDLD